MKVGSISENKYLEKRIAITPEMVKKYTTIGFDVCLSENYGSHLGIQDERYMEMGIRSFIFSGYPHLEECQLFAKHVLPRLKTVSLPEVYGRRPKTPPQTPLAAGKRN